MQIDELPGEDGQLDRPLVGVSPVNGKIFASDVAQLPKLFSKTVELGEILFVTSQDADAPYALGLLRARRERPRRRRAAAPPMSVMNSRRCSGRDVRFIARPPHRTVRAAFPHTAPTSGV